MSGIGAATPGASPEGSDPTSTPRDRSSAWRTSYTTVRKDLLAPTSWTNRRRLALLGVAAIDRSTKVLEVGSGDGNLSATFAELGFADLTGVEVQHELVAAQTSPTRTVVGSADALPVRSSSVGAVLVMDVLHHLDAAGIDAALHECRRVLRSDGALFVCEPGDTWVRRMLEPVVLSRLAGLTAFSRHKRTMLEHEQETLVPWLRGEREVERRYRSAGFTVEHAARRVLHTFVRLRPTHRPGDRS
jgi:ubiquinone/menaquinone biosynthesis C-methylase UbiE